MGAMYRLKAYFGMVPAEEMGEFSDEPAADRWPSRRSSREYADERWDDRPRAASYDADRRHDDPRHRDGHDDRHDDERDRRPSRPVAPQRYASRLGSGGATRGALAIDADVDAEPSRPAVARVPGQRERPTGSPGRITTLQPRSYNEARAIGERYRDGVPVIMNLTELDDAAAKRLVDFAAGLAFALRGSIDKVTSRVFLLTPVDVEVSADHARRLAERSAGGASIYTERSAGGASIYTERSAGTARVDAERGFFRQD